MQGNIERSHLQEILPWEHAYQLGGRIDVPPGHAEDQTNHDGKIEQRKAQTRLLTSARRVFRVRWLELHRDHEGSR